MCLCYFRTRLRIFVGIWFLSHVVAIAEKSSLSCSDWRYLLTDSANGNLIFLWKSAINIKLQAQKLKFWIRQSAPSHSLCSKPLSFSTAQYNTHPHWSFIIHCRFYKTPGIQALLLDLQHFWNFMFYISHQNGRSGFNKFISLMLLQHKNYELVHFILLDFLYIWLTYL